MLLCDYICIYGDVCNVYDNVVDETALDTYRFVMAVLYEEEALYRGCF